jgi:tetratricopeptide (TPR) repeat protein
MVDTDPTRVGVGRGGRLVRRLSLVAGLLVLAAFVGAAVQVYRSQEAPESLVDRSPPLFETLGPSASALDGAAEDQVRRGMAALGANDLPVAERLGIYRRHLRAAESLLLRSLRLQPTRADSLALLAAVRFELEPPNTADESRIYVDMVDRASAMAPRSAGVQRTIGKLFLRMGFRDEGLDCLHRTVDLEPARAPEVIGDLRAELFSLEDIVRSLPRSNETLIALADVFLEEDEPGRYADLLEPYLDRGTPELLTRYGQATLRAREPRRLVQALSSLRPADLETEAERMRQLSVAHRVLGDHDEAMRTARGARDASPERFIYTENLGDVSLALGDGETARASFRDALALLARQGDNPRVRARIYAKIGASEEMLGRPDRAYDAYRLALELNPDEPRAREAFDGMRRDAGVAPRRPAESGR